MNIQENTRNYTVKLRNGQPAFSINHHGIHMKFAETSHGVKLTKIIYPKHSYTRKKIETLAKKAEKKTAPNYVAQTLHNLGKNRKTRRKQGTWMDVLIVLGAIGVAGYLASRSSN